MLTFICRMVISHPTICTTDSMAMILMSGIFNYLSSLFGLSPTNVVCCVSGQAQPDRLLPSHRDTAVSVVTKFNYYCVINNINNLSVEATACENKISRLHVRHKCFSLFSTLSTWSDSCKISE